MVVRCIRPLRPPRGEVVSDAGLTPGKSYVVVELEIPPDNAIRVRVVDDANEPSLWLLSGFEIVRGEVPPNWELNLTEDGTLLFAPGKWLRRDFWWSYLDGDPDAVQDFTSELARMG